MTGDLCVRSDNNILLQPYSGDELFAKFVNDGAVELYYDNSKKLETNANGVNIFGRLLLGDSSGVNDNRIRLGADGDLSIYHDGSDSIIQGNDPTVIRSNLLLLKNYDNSESYIRCTNNGNVELYYDNSKKLETRSGGIGVFGHIEAGDNNKLMLGDSNDLQIYHDGSSSRIVAANHDLIVQSNGYGIRSENGSTTFATILSSGKVGIGTSSPDCKLHISGTESNLNSRIRITDTTNNHTLGLGADGSGTFQSTINDSRHIIYTNGTMRGSWTANGLCFGTDTAAANALDDYEEGSFTPTLGHSLTPSSADGTYIKVGRLVHAFLHVNFPTTSDGNHAFIGGLPFTAEASNRSGAAILRYSNDDEAYKITWHVNAGNTTMSPYYSNSGGSTANVYLSGKRFDLVVVYYASA